MARPTHKLLFYSSMAIVSAIFLSSIFLTTTAFAGCGGVDTAVIDCQGEGEEAIFGILGQIIMIMTGIIGVVAVGAVVFGAILYTSSGASPESMKKAKDIWMNTLIGLIVFAFLVALTNFLIPGGVFGNTKGGGGGVSQNSGGGGSTVGSGGSSNGGGSGSVSKKPFDYEESDDEGIDAG